jgi:hypothetical protein
MGWWRDAAEPGVTASHVGYFYPRGGASKEYQRSVNPAAAHSPDPQVHPEKGGGHLVPPRNGTAERGSLDKTQRSVNSRPPPRRPPLRRPQPGPSAETSPREPDAPPAVPDPPDASLGRDGREHLRRDHPVFYEPLKQVRKGPTRGLRTIRGPPNRRTPVSSTWWTPASSKFSPSEMLMGC